MFKIRKIIPFFFIIVILIEISSISGFSSKRVLPDDAESEQTLYFFIKNETGTYLDSMKTIYDSIRGMANLLNEPIVYENNNQEVIPLGFDRWEISEDGLTWTFYLREELRWSDNTAVTTHDYVFALQRAVKQGYDFNAYWSTVAEIKNWVRIELGELPIEELGIKALNDYTLTITTETPKSYLIGLLRNLYPVPRHQVQKYGDEYAASAETMVGNGPFIIDEWVKGNYLILVQNPHYNGIWPPYLEKAILKYGTYEPEIGFPAYLNNEIDFSNLNAGQLAYAKRNLPNELHSSPMLRLFYLSFDTTKPPFDDVRVRQAFNHALNREELCSTVLKDLAIPEYSVLMTGFPGYDAQEVKKLSAYDIELARILMAEAGYPEGKGFPAQELWIRNANNYAAWQNPAAIYIQAQLKEALGVEIIPRLIESKIYTAALDKQIHNFFMISYGYDYMDPSNFMDLFLAGSRHAWSNSNYDRLVKEADSNYDWDERIKNYRKAENILAEEVPAVFIFQSLFNTVFKPYIGGEGIEPNSAGVVFTGEVNRYALSNIYIKKH